MPVDDKQEMRRRQLEAGASAPPMDDDDDLYAGPDTPSTRVAAVPQASAPAVPFVPEQSPDDGDATLVPSEAALSHDSHAEAMAESELPRYEPKSTVGDAEPQQQTDPHNPTVESPMANVPQTPSVSEEATSAHEPARNT